jgi:hypothetical protein
VAKPRLNEDQYLAELNRQLREHEYFREGMAFVPSPEGATGRAMSGYSVTGPFGLLGVYAQVAHRVGEQFDIAV